MLHRWRYSMRHTRGYVFTIGVFKGMGMWEWNYWCVRVPSIGEVQIVIVMRSHQCLHLD